MTQQNTLQECIQLLIDSEPIFKKAGELALQMRDTAKSKNKFSTGIAAIDIVTEADTAVQEFVLSELAKTQLVECQLIAEENTPSVSKFKGTNGFILTLDPIDGTLLYAGDGRFFSTIVYLINKEDIFYSFYYYPMFDFAIRVVEKETTYFGTTPKANLIGGKDFSKAIVHTGKDLTKMGNEVYNELIAAGYQFMKASEISDEAGSGTLFFLGQVAGYYNTRPNPHDGLGALHFSRANNIAVYSDLNLAETEPSNHGPHYKGWYLVLRK